MKIQNIAIASALLLLGSMNGSPAFKAFKDALVVYKKDPKKSRALITAYENLSARGLPGEKLVALEYAKAVIGADGVKAVRDLADAAKKSGIKTGGKGEEKKLKAELEDLKKEIERLEAEGRIAKNEIEMLTTTQQSLRDIAIGKDADVIVLEGKIKKLKSKIALIRFTADLAKSKTDFENSIKAIVAKGATLEAIKELAEVLSDAKLPNHKDATDSLAFALGNDGLVKLNIKVIDPKGANAEEIVMALNEIVDVIEKKDKADSAKHATVLQDIKKEIKTVQDAILKTQEIDFTKIAGIIKVGSAKITAEFADAVEEIEKRKDGHSSLLKQYIEYFQPVIQGALGLVGGDIISDDDIKNFKGTDQNDHESFYKEYLGFLERLKSMIDKKILDKSDAQLLILNEDIEAVKKLLPKLAKKTDPKKKEEEKKIPTDPVIAKFDVKAIDAAKDKNGVTALIDKALKDVKEADVKSEKAARIAAMETYIRALVVKAQSDAIKIDAADYVELITEYEGLSGKDF